MRGKPLAQRGASAGAVNPLRSLPSGRHPPEEQSYYTHWLPALASVRRNASLPTYLVSTRQAMNHTVILCAGIGWPKQSYPSFPLIMALRCRKLRTPTKKHFSIVFSFLLALNFIAFSRNESLTCTLTSHLHYASTQPHRGPLVGYAAPQRSLVGSDYST